MTKDREVWGISTLAVLGSLEKTLSETVTVGLSVKVPLEANTCTVAVLQVGGESVILLGSMVVRLISIVPFTGGSFRARYSRGPAVLAT